MKSSPLFGRLFRQYILLVASTFLSAPAAYSTELSSAESKPTSVLIHEARQLLASGSFKEAADDLHEILIRLESSTDAESVTARSSCLYQLGLCQIETAEFCAAADSFKQFIAEYPEAEQVPAARLMALESYARQNDIPRMRVWLDELKTSGAFEELLTFFRDEKNRDLCRNTVLTLLASYAAQGDLEHLRLFLPFADEAALADVRFNLALIEGGDRAFDQEDYDRALILYEWVKPKDEVRRVYETQIAALEKSLSDPLPWVPLNARDRQMEEQQTERDRLDGLKQTLLFFNETDYDQDVNVRRAQCHDAMQRYRRSVAIYSNVYTQFPEHRLAEQCRASAFQALLALDDQDPALVLGRDYLLRYPQGRFEDEVTVGLMQLHLTRGEWSAVGDLGRHALEVSPTRRLADHMIYLLGAARLQEQKWPEAFDLFSQVQQTYPKSIYVQDAAYWGGMCLLFEGRWNECITAFKEYLDNPDYRPARFAEEVAYRLGIAQYGAEAFAESEETFRVFLTRYPDSPLVSEACSLLGDLRGMAGELDLAKTFYQQAISKAVDAEQDSYAVFQFARTLELQKRYAEIVDLIQAYIARRKSNAKLGEAGLWVSKVGKATGDLRPALDVYLRILSDFGNDPNLDGVDQALTQMVNDLKEGQGGAGLLPFATTRLTDRLALARKKNEFSLSLRLTALLSRLSDGSDRARYGSDLLSEKNLNLFSSLPLIVLAETFVDRGDIEGVDRIAEEFNARFSESEQRMDLLNIAATACLSAQQYEKTVALTEEALHRFDGDPRAALSRKLQGDAFRLSGNWVKAIETYQKVFSIRSALGSLAPETLYWIGVCHRQQDKTEKAFAFFQRVYVLYQAYPEWTAKAYESSVDCLQKLGRSDEAVQTRKEMIADPFVQNTPEGMRAAEALRRAQELK